MVPCPFLLRFKGISQVEHKPCLAIVNALPPAEGFAVLRGQPANAFAPNPGPAACGRVYHRMLDIVHAGNLVVQYAVLIKPVEDARLAQLPEPHVDLKELPAEVHEGPELAPVQAVVPQVRCKSVDDVCDGAVRAQGGFHTYRIIVLLFLQRPADAFHHRRPQSEGVPRQTSLMCLLGIQREFGRPIQAGHHVLRASLQAIEGVAPQLAGLRRPRRHEVSVLMGRGQREVMPLDVQCGQASAAVRLHRRPAVGVGGESPHRVERPGERDAVARSDAGVNHRHDEGGGGDLEPGGQLGTQTFPA